jgi:hypothetical protein
MIAALALAVTALAGPPAPPSPRAADRDLRKEVTVAAAVDDVWTAWTTSEGARTFFAPEANIRLEPGGPYEIPRARRASAAPRASTSSPGCRAGCSSSSGTRRRGTCASGSRADPLIGPLPRRPGSRRVLERGSPASGLAYAVLTFAAASSPSSAIAVSRILNFWILPVTVIGNASTNFQ